MTTVVTSYSEFINIEQTYRETATGLLRVVPAGHRIGTQFTQYTHGYTDAELGTRTSQWIDKNGYLFALSSSGVIPVYDEEGYTVGVKPGGTQNQTFYELVADASPLLISIQLFTIEPGVLPRLSRTWLTSIANLGITV